MADKELTILTGPLYTCLIDLAETGTQNDIHCLMAQLQLVGQQLEVIFLSILSYLKLLYIRLF